jgi:formylglycine-generating enzyme required for sulfatase activity
VTTLAEPRLVQIPAGAFRMGDDGGRQNERPAHTVWTDEFSLATTPVTRAEYQLFLDATAHEPPRFWGDERFADPQQPAVAVSWFDAVAYCDWLTTRAGTRYRLPTEAEREKAARGGHEGLNFPWGDDVPTWMDVTYHGDNVERPNLVAQDRANGFGLHNMGDLVHEWCADWYDAQYYETSPATNPGGAEQGQRRASRGGSWRHAIKVTRCSHRSAILPDRQLADYGFRVAR